jgi:hypothetical protein
MGYIDEITKHNPIHWNGSGISFYFPTKKTQTTIVDNVHQSMGNI